MNRSSPSRFWRFNRERYQLTAVTCNSCGERFLPPRLFCPRCHHALPQVADRVFPTLTVAEMPAPTVKATVLIPSFNAASTIRATLTSVLAQDFDQRYEVIVVDSSFDETPQIIQSEFPSVQLIHQDQQTDPGAARNLGITLAQGEVIVCIDADCITPPNWLRHMMMAQRAGHQAVGGTIENGTPQSLLAWARYLADFRDCLPAGQARLVNHVPTCNISYHRSVFARFGGFPTEFYPQEDLLFHWWLARHGVPIWFDPNIQVQRVFCTSWSSYSQHLRRMGQITSRVLKLTGEEGVFLARSPMLALLTAPSLPFIKWLRTIRVFASQQPMVLQEHALALAPLLAGLFVWAWGFVEGAWSSPLNVSHPEAL